METSTQRPAWAEASGKQANRPPHVNRCAVRRLGRQQTQSRPQMNQLCCPSRITTVGNPIKHLATSAAWENPREARVGKTIQSSPWSKRPWSAQLQRTFKARTIQWR